MRLTVSFQFQPQIAAPVKTGPGKELRKLANNSDARWKDLWHD